MIKIGTNQDCIILTKLNRGSFAEKLARFQYDIGILPLVVSLGRHHGRIYSLTHLCHLSLFLPFLFGSPKCLLPQVVFQLSLQSISPSGAFYSSFNRCLRRTLLLCLVTIVLHCLSISHVNNWLRSFPYISVPFPHTDSLAFHSFHVMFKILL